MATVTISQLRKDLFTLVDAAAKGERIEFTHKGIRFELLRPDAQAGDKLSRITPLANAVIVGTTTG